MRNADNPLPRWAHHLPQSNTVPCEDTADLLGIGTARSALLLPTGPVH